MNDLYTYASAILRTHSRVQIIAQTSEEQSWPDEGFEVYRQSITYHFDNGAVVQRAIEQDSAPSDAACGECWISYTVLQHPQGTTIEPPQRHFDNACRERRWLTAHGRSHDNQA